MDTKPAATQTAYENLKAQIDNSGKTPFLEITGSVLLYTTVANVHLERANPQGINPDELILILKYDGSGGPMKGVFYPFRYREALLDAKSYRSFRIIHPEKDDQAFPIPF